MDIDKSLDYINNVIFCDSIVFFKIVYASFILITFEKAWEAVNYIADQGLTYFAFNTKIQVCEHNHAFYGKKCPICGGDVATEYTRIVGFYTPIKTWSKERKAEFKMRQWEHINDNN